MEQKKRGERNSIVSRERERIIKKLDLWWHGSWMSEVIPAEQAGALWSYFTVAGGHLAHPCGGGGGGGGAEAVKPGANFLDNPGGKACFDLSLTQSRPSLGIVLSAGDSQLQAYTCFYSLMHLHSLCKRRK